ncbi:hypothetical protein [Liquorilactobacillus hordei]|nr:hypothetical protein [Liquorilactobacillus hordei]
MCNPLLIASIFILPMCSRIPAKAILALFKVMLTPFLKKLQKHVDKLY